MKNPTIKLVSALAIAGCLALSLNLRSQEEKNDDPVPAQPQWQHLALAHPANKAWNDKELAKQINKVGRDGWEMVTVLNFSTNGTTNNTIYYFKKPL